MLAATAPAANASLTNFRCDPNRPRNDVFTCGYSYTKRQADGTGRVMRKIRVESQGDNSELDDCPALSTTVRLILPSRRGVFPPTDRVLWQGTDKSICKGDDYLRDFRGVAGIKVPARAFITVSYKQHTNFDTDETGAFEFRVD